MAEANFFHLPSGVTDPRRGPTGKKGLWRRMLAGGVTLGFGLFAAGCPLLSVVIVSFARERGAHATFLNTASITGLLLSPLVVLRTGRLRDLLVGPTVALLAGFLDLNALIWFYYSAGWPMALAAIAPVWGGVLAVWVAATRRSWPSRTSVFAAIVTADAAGRALWMKLAADVVMGSEVLADWQWLVEPFAYSPAAVLVALLAARAQSSPDR